MGTFICAAGGVAGSVGVVTDGVHDVRVTVLDLPMVSGVQGEGGMGALHCPTCMGSRHVMLPWCHVRQRSANREKKNGNYRYIHYI